MRYELYYWPSIRDAGVRPLALEEAGPPMSTWRAPGGVAAMERLMEASHDRLRAALPAGRSGHRPTANPPAFPIRRASCAGARDEAGRQWTHQLQLTIADLVVEAHDTHHPVGGNFYYEEQKKEAKRRAADFRAERIPKFLGYFERVLARNPGGPGHLVGRRTTTADLSLFQVVEGLRYAFPRAMARLEPKHDRVIALRDRIAARPRIEAYLARAAHRVQRAASSGTTRKLDGWRDTSAAAAPRCAQLCASTKTQVTPDARPDLALDARHRALDVDSRQAVSEIELAPPASCGPKCMVRISLGRRMPGSAVAMRCRLARTRATRPRR
jgi:glutathione S-transferase